MSNYLVTGAAGFIGAAVAKKLIQSGHNVVTIDNLSTGTVSNIPDNCEFIRGNDYDKETLENLRERKFDAIIHIAGQSSGEVSFEDPVYDLQTNTQSTIMLLDYAKNTGCKNFIYASTMSVYGDHTNPYVNETTQLVPKSFYAVGKLASEHYMRIYSGFGIKCTALRLFNVYGVGQNMTNLKQGMVSIFLALAINNKHIIVKGSKDRFRDFVYIDDVASAFIKCLFRTKGEMYEVYNISSGVKNTVDNIIQKIKNSLPYEVSIEFMKGTPGDQNGIFGNSEKIYKELGWKAETNFDSGMKKMIDWALEEAKK